MRSKNDPPSSPLAATRRPTRANLEALALACLLALIFSGPPAAAAEACRADRSAPAAVGSGEGPGRGAWPVDLHTFVEITSGYTDGEPLAAPERERRTLSDLLKLNRMAAEGGRRELGKMELVLDAIHTFYRREMLLNIDDIQQRFAQGSFASMRIRGLHGDIIEGHQYCEELQLFVFCQGAGDRCLVTLVLDGKFATDDYYRKPIPVKALYDMEREHYEELDRHLESLAEAIRKTAKR